MRITLFFLLLTQFITAQNFEEVQKFVNADRAQNGLFGFNMSVSESTMVVTAPGLAVDRGAAYIFEKSDSGDWIELQKLVPNDIQVGDGFGLAGVYLNQNLLAVTSENQDFDENSENELSSAGAVYIFEKNDSGTWEELQKLVASDRDSEDIFGQSVYIDEDIIIVGAYFDSFNDQGNEVAAGSVYVFERDTNGQYQEIQKITASDPEQDAEFGITLDYKNDILVVGADRASEDANGENPIPNAGAVYVFEKQSDNTFVEMQKIVANDRSNGDAFGVLVAMSDSFITVSSSQEFASETGAIYIFMQDSSGTFIQTQRIQPEDLDAGDGFGIAAISEDYIVAGAIFEAQNETGANPVSNAGAAFIYELVDDGVTWELSQKVVPEIREENDLFGSRTAIIGNDIIVASLLEDEDENGANTIVNAGAVYVFKDATLSLEDLSLVGARIYPNPSEGQLTLDFNGELQSGTIRISNTLGQTIAIEDFENTTSVDLEIKEARGLYFVHYKTKEGRLETFKYIKI